MTKQNGHCPPDLPGSDGEAIAEYYAEAVQRVLALAEELRGIGYEEEDIAWAAMSQRLVYPAHHRFTKGQLADTLAAALSLLTSGPGGTRP